LQITGRDLMKLCSINLFLKEADSGYFLLEIIKDISEIYLRKDHIETFFL
jgi:hypothetical protein